MKTYELRFRQFARGRRSIKATRMSANTQAEAALLFHQTVLLGRIFKDPSMCHAQLISVFPAKEA